MLQNGISSLSKKEISAIARGKFLNPDGDLASDYSSHLIGIYPFEGMVKVNFNKKN